MKKTLIMTAFFFVAALCTTTISFAHPADMPQEQAMKPTPFHEQMLFRPDFTDMLLGNQELKLTDKQKNQLKRNSKATVKRVRKLDKTIRDAQEERLFVVGEHFKNVQDILTDEQKEILYQQHQKKIEEKLSKFQQMKVDKKPCKCGEKCKCTPKCNCETKNPCPINKKCTQGSKKNCTKKSPAKQPVKK